MVLVPATVRSKSGTFVTGLASRDFELTDNGVNQTALVEPTTNQPLAIALVVQTGAGSPREFQNYQTIAALLGITDTAYARKVAFITFDSKPRQVWNFPTRLDGVQYAIDHPEAGDSGASILDAVTRAIDLLQQQPPQMRRILLLLSQSQDAGSSIAPLSFLRRLGESNIAVYSITFPTHSAATHDSRYQACLSKTDRASRDAAPDMQDLLQNLCGKTAAELATLSGGEHIEIKNPLDLSRSISLLTDAFSNAYSLSFRPNAPSPGLHLLSLKAGTQSSRLFVSSRAIYWASDK
jgi:VWFA-related protein